MGAYTMLIELYEAITPIQGSLAWCGFCSVMRWPNEGPDTYVHDHYRYSHYIPIRYAA